MTENEMNMHHMYTLVQCALSNVTRLHVITLKCILFCVKYTDTIFLISKCGANDRRQFCRKCHFKRNTVQLMHRATKKRMRKKIREKKTKRKR